MYIILLIERNTKSQIHDWRKYEAAGVWFTEVNKRSDIVVALKELTHALIVLFIPDQINKNYNDNTKDRPIYLSICDVLRSSNCMRTW
jgi:hypothetical protein